MKINKVIPSLIKVSDKLSTTKDFVVVAHIDSIIKKLAKSLKGYNIKLAQVGEEDLHFANEVDIPIIRDAAVVTLIQIADVLDKTNTKLADRIDSAIKLLARNNCRCECNNCSMSDESGMYKHCCNTEKGCKI